MKKVQHEKNINCHNETWRKKMPKNSALQCTNRQWAVR